MRRDAGPVRPVLRPGVAVPVVVVALLWALVAAPPAAGSDDAARTGVPSVAAAGDAPEQLSLKGGAQEPARIAGADRYATAARVAQAAFDQPDTVYVASGEGFADAVVAGAAAAAAGGPVLLTPRDSLPDVVRQALVDLAPSSVVIVGGRAVISEAVERAVGAALASADVRRVGGVDRFATAAALAAEVGPAAGGTVLLATARAFPDALTGATLAAVRDAPLLLTEPDALDLASAEVLALRRPNGVLVIGGTSAVGEQVAAAVRALVDDDAVVRIAGDDRYGTAVAVADEVDATDTTDAVTSQSSEVGPALLASGQRFPDALVAAPAAAEAGVPLLLTATDCQPRATRTALVDRGIAGEVTIIGGTAAVRTPAALPVRCEPVRRTVLADNLDVPWDVVVVGDAAYLSLRDTGDIVRLTPDGATSVVATLAVDPSGEGGLLGLATDPADGRWLYAYRTTGAGNEVVRLDLAEPDAAPEVVLHGIPSGRIHNGGRIAFGPDGMLYIATGDAGVPSSAADPESLAGAILRVTPDGAVPDDNPRPGSPVWSYGHRNVQGLAWLDDALYATEFGPDRDDEINRIVSGGNYGWPQVTGVAGRAGLRDPVLVRQPSVASWSGLSAITDTQIADWEGRLLTASLRGRRLWHIEVDDGRVRRADDALVGTLGRLRQVRRAPDGAVWVLTSNTDGRGSPGPDDDQLVRIGRPRYDDRGW